LEDAVLPVARRLGTGIIPYSPLGRGFLTGQLTSPDDFASDDFRRTNPRFQLENFQRNLDLVAEVRRLADEKHFTAGQLALAWLLAQGEDVLPIPGMKRRAAQVVDSRAYS
jgi:aryl-alcohol dehydrogenase-like predicted oxidoreductase